MNWLKKLFKKKELNLDIPEEDLLILMGINPPPEKKKLPSTYWAGYDPYISTDREDLYNSISSSHTDQITTEDNIQFDRGTFGGAGASGSWESDSGSDSSDSTSFDSGSFSD